MNPNSLDNEDITRYVAKVLWKHTLKYIAENPLEYYRIFSCCSCSFCRIC